MAPLNRSLLAAAVLAALPIARPASSQTTDDPAAVELLEHYRHHHYGGITQFIAMSLGTIGADEAKLPRIEKLQDDLNACMAPEAQAERDVLETLADGVDAGNIDAKKIDGQIERLESLSAKTHPCSVETLDRLHAILSAQERQALVDQVQTQWQLWRKVNHEEKIDDTEPGSRLAALAAELVLPQVEVGRIAAGLRAGIPAGGGFDLKTAERNMRSFAAAFLKDSFEAKGILADAGVHLTIHGAMRMAHFYETAAPILTPEQRTALAEHLRERADEMPSAT